MAAISRKANPGTGLGERLPNPTKTKNIPKHQPRIEVPFDMANIPQGMGHL